MDRHWLVSQLHDADDDARWRATEELALAGPEAVDAVLDDLAHSILDEKLRQSCLYVLEHQPDDADRVRMEPVTQALHGLAFRTEAPLAAKRALEARARS